MEADTQFILGLYRRLRCGAAFVLDNGPRTDRLYAEGELPIADHGKDRLFIESENRLIDMGFEALYKIAVSDLEEK